MFTFLGSGICYLLTGFLDVYGEGEMAETAATVFAVAGKFFSSMCYSCIYVYSAELYPTSCRNTGFSSVVLASRIASIIVPYIVQGRCSRFWRNKYLLFAYASVRPFLYFDLFTSIFFQICILYWQWSRGRSKVKVKRSDFDPVEVQKRLNFQAPKIENFGQKLKFQSKIRILLKNRYFGQIIEILVKSRDFENIFLVQIPTFTKQLSHVHNFQKISKIC